MDKPIIGIAGQTEIAPDAYGVKRRYVEYLRRHGADVVLVAPGFDEKDASGILQQLDGLLLPGGDNVDPARYGTSLGVDLPLSGSERDGSELALVLAARGMRMPVLGLCRGLQVVNVALGGTLLQQLPDHPVNHWQAEPFSEPSHSVHVDEGSSLAAALGNQGNALAVNSMHRQAVDLLAPDLVAAAWADDGVIEGAYDPHLPFFMAVQWHPEFLAEDASSDALGSAFVTACGAFRRAKRHGAL